MKERCTNPKNNHYHLYGGRGITFCERWNSFEEFLKDMGLRPEGATLDRIDNNGNYEPSNCRWATAHTQIRNNNRNVNVTYKGITKCLKDWADELGITGVALSYRIRKFPLDIAMSRDHIPHATRRSLYTANGESLTIKEWAERLEMSQLSLRRRIQKHGLEEALKIPLKKNQFG